MEPYKERRSRFSESFPWVEDPFISNAPMSGFATNELAVAVTKAGGLGQIGFTGNPGILHRELEEAKQKLDRIPVYNETSKVVPVGVSIIAFGGSAKAWIQVFAKYRPAMVWLSFGTSDELKLWIENIRAVSPDTKGTDAGGHGHKYRASIITLIPEASDALHEKGLSNIPIITAGGIMDKRGVAAAVALGASGVVMGMRFLACYEIEIASDVVDECLVASDGGEATVRSRVFDDIWGQNFWPDMYDGRCLRNAIYDNVEEVDMSIQEARVDLANRSSGGKGSALVVRDSYTIWAGTGVGMLKKREQAADIVKQNREQTKDLMKHRAGIM